MQYNIVYIFLNFFSKNILFRYDKDDACKAAKQLTRNLITWSSKYNVNCDESSQKENKFHNKISEQLADLERRLKKRYKCT